MCILGGAPLEKSCPPCNDVMMSSIWIEEWSVCVYMSLSPIHVSRFILRHSSPGGEQTKGAWVIRPPPTVGPLTQTAQWHQAEQQPAKKHQQFHALKHTPCTVKDYTHHIFIIVGGTRSRGQVNTFCLAAYEQDHLCGMYIKSISSMFASEN